MAQDAANAMATDSIAALAKSAAGAADQEGHRKNMNALQKLFLDKGNKLMNPSFTGELEILIH